MIERSRVRLPAGALSGNNCGQVANTHVPLSPSSTIWYRPKGGDALRLGRPGITLGHASHTSGLSTYGLTATEREMSTPPTLQTGAWSTLPKGRGHTINGVVNSYSYRYAELKRQTDL